MAWQENSIMASKGLAKGKRGIHHMITEADQADQVIRSGKADLVVMAREFLRQLFLGK